jgi:hexosaminidase
VPRPRPAVSLPAYRWRGVSLDVARRFFPPATLRRFIVLAAHYRLNIVHLHLTDNEAWRLPSRAYPRLPSQQHYTLAQLHDLVAFAKTNGITLVPEIDLPAHAAAAIRAYPQLACGSPDTLCAAGAGAFARTVIGEAMRVFPGAYIHMGGDEVFAWTKAERERFEVSLDRFIRSRRRIMEVWDDESDATPADVLVEVWHLGGAARDAASRGHRIVAAPDGPLYFDAVQGARAQEPPGTRYMSTLEEVYATSVPNGAFGVEAVVWSEYLSDESQLWYALLPREAAFGAVALMEKRRPPWRVFRDTVLPREFAWLTARGYPYRVPNTLISLTDPQARYGSVPGDPDAAVAYTRARTARVVLRSLVPRSRIVYRTGGAQAWRGYRGPFTVSAAGARIEARTIAPGGRFSAITALVLDTSRASAASRRFDDVVSP